jgi:hypothetical protein
MGGTTMTHRAGVATSHQGEGELAALDNTVGVGRLLYAAKWLQDSTALLNQWEQATG